MIRKNGSTFNKPHLLAVEGDDDFHFVVRMLGHLNIDSVHVHCLDGVNSLPTKLTTITKTPGFGSVARFALLVDSDSDPGGRQQSIRTALQIAGLPVPAIPDQFAGTSRQVKYSTVPGPTAVGCLDDLLIQTFAGEPNASCVGTYLACAGVTPGPLGSRWSKAWVHSYLATFPTPGLKIGEAAKAGYINVSAPQLAPVRNFISSFVT